MIGFLAGIVTAAALSVVMLVCMQSLYVPTEMLHAGPNLNLDEHLIEQTVGGGTEGD